MRIGGLLLAATLVVPVAAHGQAKKARDVERFELSKLPTTGTSDLEKEILVLLRVHKKGDFADASRIHAKLAQYYKELGDPTLSDACSRMAMEAWEAASGERSFSAGSQGSPPFEPKNTFARSFAYTDEELKVEHVWDFFEDGTYAHSVTGLARSTRPGPRELGWYTIEGPAMRLWQLRPRVDKTVTLELSGEGGKDGMVLDGVKMRAVP